MTYGYLGAAAGFNSTILIAGSVYAAGIGNVIKDTEARNNEFEDHKSIKEGILLYKEIHK